MYRFITYHVCFENALNFVDGRLRVFVYLRFILSYSPYLNSRIVLFNVNIIKLCRHILAEARKAGFLSGSKNLSSSANCKPLSVPALLHDR